MRLAAFLFRTLTRICVPPGLDLGVRLATRGCHPGSSHRQWPCARANAGCGPWDLLRAPAGMQICGPDGWSARSGPAWPWPSPASRSCLSSWQLPVGHGAVVRRAPIPEMHGSPGASLPCYGRPPILAAPANRWARKHPLPVWGRLEPRPERSTLARRRHVQQDPRARGE